MLRGDPIPVRDGVVRCLYCHVTYPRDFRDPAPETGVGPEAADSGIGCERCHGPGGNHLKAIQAGFSDNSIVNLGTKGAATIGELCADCHVVDQIADIQRAPDEPAYVRSPGLTLTFSRCFSESDGSLSCLTCHDAHRDDRQPPSFYEAKCLTCHASQAVAAETKAGARQARLRPRERRLPPARSAPPGIASSATCRRCRSRTCPWASPIITSACTIERKPVLGERAGDRGDPTFAGTPSRRGGGADVTAGVQSSCDRGHIGLCRMQSAGD